MCRVIQNAVFTLVQATRNFTRTESQKKTLVQQALTLEDDVANQNSSNKYYKRSSGQYKGVFKMVYNPTVGEENRLFTSVYIIEIVGVIVTVFSITLTVLHCD